MTATQTNELARVVEEVGLEPASATRLLETFQPYFNQVMTIYEKSSKIVVTDATQLTEMKQAKAARLSLREVRVASEKTRKAFKADALKACNIIDKVAGVITTMADIEEARLLEQEQFAARAEAERKASLKIMREAELRAVGVDPTFYQWDIPAQQFASLISGIKAEQKAKIEAAELAKAESAKAELARIEEERKVRAENERLRLEARQREAAAELERKKVAAERKALEEKAAKDKADLEAKARKSRIEAEDKARKEREAAEAVLRKEREERAAIEAKLAAERKAAADKAKAESDAKRKAERAPDKDKLRAFYKALQGLPFPEMATAEGKDAVVAIKVRIDGVLSLITLMAKEL